MAERNAHVSFPELLTPRMTLEKLVVDMAHGKFLPFGQLPGTLSAGNIETYANWISKLIQQDPLQAERGAVLHVRADNDRIIFPSTPDVGDDRVGWVISKKRDIFVPTIDVHSHRIDVCHSPARSDMTTVISGFGKNEDRFAPTGMLVATPGHNYLIIKSQETPVVDDEWDVYKKEYKLFDQDAFRRFRRFGSQVGQSIDSTRYWQVFKQTEEILGMSFDSYYQNFLNTINLTEAYNLGFYRSTQDGNYIRLTRPMVMEQLTQRFDEILNAALIPSLSLRQDI